MEQLHLQFDEASSYQDPDAGRSVAAGATKENEAKRSISYVMDAVLQFGKVSGFADLLDRVATLCVTTRPTYEVVRRHLVSSRWCSCSWGDRSCSFLTYLR